MNGYIQITRKEFFRWGGLMNPKLMRVQRRGVWCYYRPAFK